MQANAWTGLAHEMPGPGRTDSRIAGARGRTCGCQAGLQSARPPQEEATPSVLGHHLGLLALLWRDKDPVTRSHSRQCIYLLLQLLTQQRGERGRERGAPGALAAGRPPAEVVPLRREHGTIHALE